MNAHPDRIAVLCAVADRGCATAAVERASADDDRIAVTAASGSDEALAALAERAFDCVVATPELSDGAGIELLSSIRSAGHEVPFVLVASETESGVAAEAAAAGVDGYVPTESIDEDASALTDRVHDLGASHRTGREADRADRVDAGLSAAAGRLVAAETAEEVERTVCSAMAVDGPYERAWVAVADGDGVRPTVTSDAVAGAAEEPIGDGGAADDDDGLADSDPVADGDADTGDAEAGNAEAGDAEAAIRQAIDGDDVCVLSDLAERSGVREGPSAGLVGDDDAVVAVPIGGPGVEPRALVVADCGRDAVGDGELAALARVGETATEALRTAETRTRLTDRNRQLAVERDRFEAAFEAIPYPVAHVEIDSTGENLVNAVNSAFARVFDCDRTAVQGTPINDLIVPQGSEEAARTIDRQVADGELVEAELERLAADGPRTFLFRGRDFAVGDGRREAIGVYVDISDRERRARELERYERVIEAAGDPVYTLDADGRFTYVNAQLGRLTGYDPSELVGEHIATITSDSDVERGRELIRELLANPERNRGTLHMAVETRDGESIPTDIHVALLPFEEEFVGTVGVIRDVSARVERERQLERQNERLEAFSGIVGHDLRNPLTVAQGHLDLARTDEDPTASLDAVDRALTRMEGLIDDLLTLAREGQGVSDVDVVDLTDIVEDCRPVASALGCRLVSSADRRLYADRSRLQQLVENLLRNAVEHGGEDVTVRIGDTETGFFVADDGPGIEPDERERVFEMGYSTSGDGTGLGLSIVETVVDAHGWSIAVTESAGGGARFDISGVERPADE
ncbi:PAS domain S-box protein (plasmid) [Halobaculum sp. CBA1158]|uniref:PAS domain S-box protein n=1 Tax=Halobaculum sp. CBA1158 TaxID=2904243 RepID=UPI001F1BA3BA|nr:PAS domain S-box protein [Halobaculum sp. CBA1158]UIP01470.1 PAS domain S-box protein [Halobaculum sp. CBA1158]